MRKWYRNALVKTVLSIIVILSAIVVGLSAILLIGNQDKLEIRSDGISGLQADCYEDSSAFKSRFCDVVYSVKDGIDAAEIFETADGKYDPDRLVDIMEYDENGKISGENKSGISYKLGDLGAWDGSFDAAEIVVCKKTDGTYYYYYLKEFEKLLENGSLILSSEDDEEAENVTLGTEEVISCLKNGFSPREYYGEKVLLLNAEQVVVYKDFWAFQNGFAEKATPVGAENILEVINKTPALNGKLEDVFDALNTSISSIAWAKNQYEAMADMWLEGNTNLQYLFVDKDNKKVYTNNSAYTKFEDAQASIEKIKSVGKYVVVKPKLVDFETNINTDALDWQDIFSKEAGDYIFAAAVDTKYPVHDLFYTEAKEYEKYNPYLKNAGVSIVLGGMLLLIALVWLTMIAGRHPEDEELHLNAFDRWKTIFGAAAVIVPWFLVSSLLATNWTGVGYSVMPYEEYTHYNYIYYIFSMTAVDAMVIAGYVGITMSLFLIGYLSLVRRIKGRTIWKNSFLRWICRGIARCWRHRGVCLRALLLVVGFILVHWLSILAYGNSFFVLLMFAAELAAVYFVVRGAIEKESIRKGIKEIASGNVEYQIPVEKMHGESREMAELVNSIGDGLNNAVAAAMKSERLKTDLITNVSHDIKTPLTSIINYVDLLKRENFDDPKIRGYLEILEAKAQRLKTLTEDVVEASKVSSGNITLEMMDVNLVEMVNQTIGEFSEKMEAKNLTVVASLPEEPAIVHVDGRRMWRVLENIFNNTAKYALAGTRVYVDLQVSEAETKAGVIGKITEGIDGVKNAPVKKKIVRFSMKNISENPLNINAEELTERFIRGDVSRSTEGSGLGLSIARDLTEMQGGKFSLYVDGDLFKVMIEF